MLNNPFFISILLFFISQQVPLEHFETQKRKKKQTRKSPSPNYNYLENEAQIIRINHQFTVQWSNKQGPKQFFYWKEEKSKQGRINWKMMSNS